MNRSLNSLNKSKNNKRSNQPVNSCSSVGFKTVFKMRGSNQILPISNNMQKVKKSTPVTQPCQQITIKQRYSSKNKQQNIDFNERKRQLHKFDDEIQDVQNNLDKLKNKEMKQIQKGQTLIKSAQATQLNEDKFTNYSNYTLQFLIKKVQQLIQLKMLKNMRSRNCQDQLQKQLQLLISLIQKHQAGSDLNQIKQASQKINIIQKIMAQNCSESQLLKKYYFHKTLTKKPLGIIQNKIKLTAGQQALINKRLQTINHYPSLHFSTTSQSSYCQPGRSAYLKQQRYISNILPNRQSLGKSSYNCQFLNYGSMPVYPSSKPSQSSLATLKLVEQKSSIYKTDYKSHKIKEMDTQNLDCKQNKYRPTNISFMPKKMMEEKQNIEIYNKKSRKLGKCKIQATRLCQRNSQASHNDYPKWQQSSLAKSSFFENSSSKFKSEYRSSFAGQKAVFECLAKQSSLSNLKYEFKKNTNA